MKKQIVSLLMGMLVAFSTLAQDDEAIYKTLAEEACACIHTKMEGKASLGRKELEILVGLCMLEGISKHKLDVSVSDEGAMEKFGEKLGMQMAPICPEVFTSLVEQEGDASPADVELTGQVRTVEVGEFVYLVVKESSGKEHRLLWMEYFPGSDDYQDNPKKFTGKQVSLTYKLVESYSPKAKVYYDTKVITGIQVMN